MSYSLLEKLLPQRLNACEAVRTKGHYRKVLREESFAKAAAPHVEKMIAEIETASKAGRGQCRFMFGACNATDEETVAFACNYIRMEGFKIEPDRQEQESDTAGYMVLIRWLD